jgi:DNA-binding LytR/AlgR family response regulator
VISALLAIGFTILGFMLQGGAEIAWRGWRSWLQWYGINLIITSTPRRNCACCRPALRPELEIVAIARNGVQAAKQINARQPDIAFRDIQMPGWTLHEVAQGNEGAGKRVVFVTANDECAVLAFEARAIDCLLKPLKAERLQRTLARLRQAADTPDSALLAALQRLLPAAARGVERLRWVRAGSGDLTHQVAVDDVLFFRADDMCTSVQTASAECLLRTPPSNRARNATRRSSSRCNARPSSTWPIWPALGAR